MRAIYYDVETTGLSPERDRVVEIAAYDPDGGRQFDQLINPGSPIPKESSAIHNITDEMVANKPPFAEVAVEFAIFCGEDAVLIAHNNDNFDRHFLRQEFERSLVTLPSWRFFDTLKWARRYRPDLPRHTLQFLREIYGIAANQAHRAFDDVMILYEVFSRMVDDLSFETIYDLLNGERVVTHMPFGKHQGQPLEEVPTNYLKWLVSSGALDKEENLSLKVSLETRGLI